MSKTERIVEAAGKRFLYYGVAKTTMQEIAVDAGVAVGTLYLYFKNKDELVAACAEVFIRRHLDTIEAILSSAAAPDEKLRQYVVARFRAAEETRTGSRHAAEIARAVLRVKPDRLEHEGQMMWATLVQILASGVDQGMFHIADPEGDAKVFLYSIAGFFPIALGAPIVPPVEADLLLVVNWFLATWKRPLESAGRVRKRKASAARPG
jgi:AcrR family transcriptional regulator